jgi:hypothetical protein
MRWHAPPPPPPPPPPFLVDSSSSPSYVQVAAWRATVPPTDDAGNPTPLTLVVLDGTWRQARRIEWTVPPDIPRVHITPAGPSINLLRQARRMDDVDADPAPGGRALIQRGPHAQQSRHDRISTLEATAMLLRVS